MTTKPGMVNFLTTDLYGLTSWEHSLGRSNVEVVEQMIAAVRSMEPRLSVRRIYRQR